MSRPRLPLKKQKKSIWALKIEDDPRPVRISSALNSGERTRMEKLLKKYMKVLAFSYGEMPRLDSLLVEHRLPLKPGAMIAKQKL